MRTKTQGFRRGDLGGSCRRRFGPVRQRGIHLADLLLELRSERVRRLSDKTTTRSSLTERRLLTQPLRTRVIPVLLNVARLTRRGQLQRPSLWPSQMPLLSTRQPFQKPLTCSRLTILCSASSQSSRSYPSSRPRCSYSSYAKAAILVLSFPIMA